MSLQQLNRSGDLKRLRDDSYDVVFIGGHLVLRGVPYVTKDRAVERGSLIVAQLNMAGDVTAQPQNHEMLWIGGSPRTMSGDPLPLGEREVRTEIAPGLVSERRFSVKLQLAPNGQYDDYYQMFATYYSLIAAAAEALDARATTRVLGPYVPDADESVFNYLDTATSRAGIPEATRRLELG